MLSMSLARVSGRPVHIALLLLIVILVLASAQPMRASALAYDPHATRSRSGAIPPKSTQPAPAGEDGFRAGFIPQARGGEASGKGDVGANVVVGADDRTRVGDTTRYPSSAMVHIVTNFGKCSGFLIDDDTVATAGHCVYKHAAGGWATSMTVIPARDGGYWPYNSCTALAIYTVDGWVLKKQAAYDYAAIKLNIADTNCRVGSSSTGWLGFRVVASPVGQPVTLMGYPNNKSGTLWRGAGSVSGANTAFLSYTNDAAGGQDGGPVWNARSSTCGHCAIAIHTRNNVSTSFNQGIRINQPVFDNLVAWCDATA